MAPLLPLSLWWLHSLLRFLSPLVYHKDPFWLQTHVTWHTPPINYIAPLLPLSLSFWWLHSILPVLPPLVRHKDRFWLRCYFYSWSTAFLLLTSFTPMYGGGASVDNPTRFPKLEDTVAAPRATEMKTSVGGGLTLDCSTIEETKPTEELRAQRENHAPSPLIWILKFMEGSRKVPPF